jgi:putative ABC transport system permease protein
LRDALVVSQVAISLLLLIGAGLFLRSLQSAYSADLGFETRNALIATVDLELQEYDSARGKAFFEQLQERVAGLPGVESVTLASFLPVSDSGMRRGITIEGYTPQPGEDTELNLNVVGPNYFQTMGISFISGRDFARRDIENAPQVAIINEAMARRFWPNQEAVGKRISFSGPNGPLAEIIGVVKTGKYRALREDSLSFIYIPLAQSFRLKLSIIAKTSGDPLALAAALKDEIKQLDKNLPVFDIKPLTQLIGEAVSQERMVATLLGVFGLLAMALAMVGIYGVMSYSVTQRTHEIGVRMALGAEPRSILRLIVNRGLALTLAGIAIGLGGALMLTRVTANLLFGVSATDPLTFAAIPLILIVVALLACWVPARRAAKVDPMIALRYE